MPTLVELNIGYLSSSSSFEGYPLQVRHKQDWGRGYILLLPETAALPESDAGSGVIYNIGYWKSVVTKIK